MHYGRPFVGLGGFYMRCERLVMVEERWTMTKQLVTCEDCQRIIAAEKSAARVYCGEGIG